MDDLAGSGYQTLSVEIPDGWNHAALVIDSHSNSSTGAERYDFDNTCSKSLQQEVLRLRARIQKLTALLRVLLVVPCT